MKTHLFGSFKKTGLIALLTGGLVLAATIFDPDWIDSGTNATQPIGYIGAPSASGYLLTTAQEIYTIDYNVADWSGDLHSRTLNTDGSLLLTDNWGNGANFHLGLQDYNSGRLIVTSNGASGVAFRWGNLSSAQQTALDPATASGASTSPVLDYIRGQRSNEAPSGVGYRARNSEGPLGDIIHSTPLHWNDGTDRTVFVGSNDGMLHAFNAGAQADGGGRERFAYIPSQLIPKLPLLTQTSYTHRYFVDGQLAARQYPEYTESGGTLRAETSILVGGLGGGGKGLFALNISDIPTDEASAAAKVLWEISSATTGFANLGHTYGTPVLTRLPNGNAALVVGNGYNNSGNGHATLLIINPHTGAKIAELDTGSGSTTSPNGLSSPTVADVNLDGKADYVYAGDIDGNLWKFDLSNLASTPVKLFPTDTATQTSPAQAITMAPGYKDHPLGGRMVTFVTGRIFETGDASDTATHYAYGIWDRPAAYAANDTLLTQTLTEVSYTGVTPAIRVRTATSNVPDWAPGSGHHMGWKTALPVGGERVVGDGAFVTGSVFLFFATNPAVSTSATPPGENWWMQLNALTGGDNAAVRFDLNSDTHFTTADKVDGVSPVGRFMGGGVRS
ncbi:MAG: PilC/PilY family type IV pilus protein, partial [Sideroxydans sp.]|nr:PilC/PilY family type IV pilus protein [Sideroxydans sp.]